MSGVGCDHCGGGFDESAEIVVVYEEGGRLHVAVVREHPPDADDRAFLTGLNFHRVCYGAARTKEPPLPPLDSSG